jgi:hypothetical protein
MCEGGQVGNSYSRIASLTMLGNMNVFAPSKSSVREITAAQDTTTLSEVVFDSMLTHERLRTERSRTPFVLMLLDTARVGNRASAGILKQAAEVVQISKRETDLLGWFKENSTLGVLFIEVNLDGNRPITDILQLKIEAAMIKHLGREKAAKISISLQVFPESAVEQYSDWAADPTFNSHNDRKESIKDLSAVMNSR